MGKLEEGGEQQQLPTSVGGNSNNRNVENSCCSRRLSGFVKLRCVFALIFGVAVFLSAIFLLPFFHNGDLGDLDLDPKFRGHDIVASFMLEKPTSFMEDHILQLKDDIFSEISVSNTKVEIISLENIVGSNITRVVFTVDSNVKNMRISPTALSLVRSDLESVITHQSPLRLSSAALFGDPFSFDLLKLRGGITVSPKQSGFLMLNVQIQFNFTLNSTIDEIQDKFDELTSQLKLGVHLASYENLYIKLTNTRGSTVNPPTIIQCQVFLVVGIPSSSRLKQLAQTIGSHSKNLGLNNTVFGKVKQVSLSSTLQHSLGGDGPSPSPSPAPQPHHHHHHHHHHHRQHQDSNVAPAISPASRAEKGRPVSRKARPISAPVLAPAPVPATHRSRAALPPCHIGRYHRKANSHPPVPPPVRAPVPAPHIAPAPQQQRHAPTPNIPHKIPTASSPLPSVVYAHAQPPPSTPSVAEPPHTIPSSSHLPSSSFTGIFSLWALTLFLLLVPRL